MDALIGPEPSPCEDEERDGWFLTARHRRLREDVREFAEREVAPLIPEMESSRRVHAELSRRIAARGWLGVTIGCEYGGMGAGHLAKTLVIEELARVSGAMGAMVQASQLGAAKIIHFGSKSQKRRWLPRIAEGSCLPTIAVTEHGSGGHVAGMEASAVRDGDAYVLTGRKVYIGNSHVGTLHGVVARTGPGSQGLTAFLVEADRPGCRVEPQREALGLHGFSFGELVLEGCRVPVKNRIGNEGAGLRVAYASSTLYGRPNLTAVSLGIHQAIADEVGVFVKERVRYGKPLHELAVVRARVGRITSRLMTARLLAYHAAALLDRGLECDAELMNAKLVNTEAAVDSAREAMEIHASVGLFTDRPVERYLRDSMLMFAPAGTSDVQVLRLAESALGLGRAPWSGQLAGDGLGASAVQEDTRVPAVIG
ncbi:acyl-CoA dehydrogenase family protein [Streptomyces sp. NPDC059816]|uniref:acyl-CoA dehydrogenase family protein n=1 Tax=Streptomyces sp. NPDC059816 TaxID=3346960 RepID=UPI00366129EF